MSYSAGASRVERESKKALFFFFSSLFVVLVGWSLQLKRSSQCHGGFNGVM